MSEEKPVQAGDAESPAQVVSTIAESDEENGSIERVFDLEVPVEVELGRTTLTVEEILKLRPGTVVELDRAADQPVDLLVHGKRVARGEIVVIDDFYGIRITAVGEES